MVAVDICNLALSYLGDAATVASIDPPEGSAQAQHCARFYPMALNLLLESHQWNFSTVRALLALVENPYSDAWNYAYALPSDTTDVISVLPQCLYPTNYFDVAIAEYWWGNPWPYDFELNALRDFQIENFNGQQVVLSNAENAVVRYCMSTVQPGMFPALFSDALAWKLASMLAGPLLKGDAGAAQAKACLAMHVSVLGQAKSQDANQRHDSYQPPAGWIAARA